jgi:hypothetical protein
MEIKFVFLILNVVLINSWQPYVAMSFVRVKAPVEIYNCRAKFKVNKDGTVLQFRENSPGEMICSFFLQKS